MKRTFWIVISGIVVAGAALFAGCNQQKPAAEAGGKVVSAEQNSFKEVTSQLDQGGELYLYLSTEEMLSGLSARISGWRKIFLNLPNLEEGPREQAERVFDVVTNLVRNSGLEAVSGFGMSSVAVEKGFYRTKAILHHYPNNGSGVLWKVFGERSHALDGLDLLPSTTALAIFSDLNLSLAWAEIQSEINQSEISEAKTFLEQVPDSFEKATGIKWDQALGSLGGEYGIVFTLDEAKMTSIPLPSNRSLELPDPGLMIAIKIKDETLFQRAERALKQTGMQVESVDNATLKMRTVALPLPVSVRPSIAVGEGWLFIATTDSLIQEALAVKSGRKPGLKNTDEFKHLSKGIPSQGNQFSYMSPLFGKTLLQAQRQVLESTSKAEPAEMEWVQSLVRYDKTTFSYCVSSASDEGWMSVGNGSAHPAKMLLLPAMIVPAGILSAIAIPNFVKGREAAQRNACINNLRRIDAAKAQWALEKGKRSADIPSVSDLSPYMLDGAMPACPAGGHYTLGSVSDRPSCTVPGHRLSN